MIVLLAATGGAALGAALSAYFSSRLFKSEALWKRQINAYDRINEALYDISEALREDIKDGPGGPSPSAQKKFEEQLRSANKKILRLLIIEGYMLSERASELISEYLVEIVPDRHKDDWWTWRDRQVKAYFSFSSKLLKMARDDVSVPRPKWVWRRGKKATAA